MVAVYPVVKVNVRATAAAVIVQLVLPNVPTPSNVTSSAFVGAA